MGRAPVIPEGRGGVENTQPPPLSLGMVGDGTGVAKIWHAF